MSVTTWPFIQHGADGVAYIEGTRTKVIEVALDQLAYDWDADEIHRQYPYLSLPQIHAALGYYYENRNECDRLIDKQLAEVDQWREQSQNVSFSAKLRARLGRIVFTRDRDFLALGRAAQLSGAAFSGIVYAHQLQVTIGQAIRDLELICQLLTPDEARDQIYYLPL
jgi:uncharacterized protein (DUF433 family)